MVKAVSKIAATILVLFLLVGCERLYMLDDTNLTNWFKKSESVFLDISNTVAQYRVRGSLKDPDSIKGNFISNKEKEVVVKSLLSNLSKLKLEPKDVQFHFIQNESLSYIAISLYLEGFCIALSNCSETYLVFYSDENEKIIENDYSYIALGGGWFILRVQ
ncbi:hypothetical protein PLUTE_a0881 [Pseudoalteromonas luteoviolacea DSM 6061]|nr:hypothetical protein [Pseudoalteromonas luteoviolacea DSM 6061]